MNVFPAWLTTHTRTHAEINASKEREGEREREEGKANLYQVKLFSQ